MLFTAVERAAVIKSLISCRNFVSSDIGGCSDFFFAISVMSQL